MLKILNNQKVKKIQNGLLLKSNDFKIYNQPYTFFKPDQGTKISSPDGVVNK